MKRLISLTALILVVAATTPTFAVEKEVRANVAADFMTVPVMANVVGVGGVVFQTYVALLNPTASTFNVFVTLYDANGTIREATIPLAPRELKTYSNFLDEIFRFTGGGSVTFDSSDSPGGTRNNRFIVNAEIRTAGARYGTSIPALELDGTASRSFSSGVTVDSNTRTNIGCINGTGLANRVRATVYDNSGRQVITTIDLNLAPNGWRQTAIIPVVTGGYVQFDPAEDAVCYAVVVDNSTSDGRFITASEYQP